MRLTRLGTVELTRPSPAQLGRWTMTASNGVPVRVTGMRGAADITNTPNALEHGVQFTWPRERTGARLVLQASVDAGAPSVDKNSLARVPNGPRRLAEAAIVEYADRLSVVYQCRRVIRSPKPCLALTSDLIDGKEILRAAAGIRAPQSSRPRARLLPALQPDNPIGELISDRLDGPAFLADSLSADGPVGEVHDMFRLFEHAFASGPKSCVEPLLELLTAPDLGWTSDELADWFERLRSEVTYADMWRRDTYARAADVTPFLGRIEYAAYDVLLNKKTRHSRDWQRRDDGIGSSPGEPDRLDQFAGAGGTSVKVRYVSRIRSPCAWPGTLVLAVARRRSRGPGRGRPGDPG